ncbi:MAG: phospholipase D/Transphosphatidylase, partial [Bacteroidetes bacterium]
VFTGSHNWSVSADTKNDENTLIIHDDTIANIYYQSFNQNFIDLGGTLAPCAVTAIEEVSENEITISPNPSEGKLKVESLKSKVENVEVYNLLGIQLYAMSPSGRGLGGGLSVDLSGIQTGIYFLRIKTDKETFVRKIIIR